MGKASKHEEVTDDSIYSEYLEAFVVAGSGGSLNGCFLDVRLSAARALGVTAAKYTENGDLPWVKAQVIAEVNEMMTAKSSEDRPCKVVPMKGDDK